MALVVATAVTATAVVAVTSSLVGAATLTAKHRLRIAGITRVDELQQRIRRQVAQYFSMVRLNACWASFVNRSTSVSNTTATQHRYNRSTQTCK